MSAAVKAFGSLLRGTGRAIDSLGVALQGNLAYKETRTSFDRKLYNVYRSLIEKFYCSEPFSNDLTSWYQEAFP